MWRRDPRGAGAACAFPMSAVEVVDVPSEDQGKSKRGAHLTPFTHEAAVEAGRKSGEVRRERARLKAIERKQGAAALAALVETYEGQNLPETAVALALELMRRVAAGEVPVRNGAEAAALLDKLHAIYRLETGQSTSNALSLSGSAEEVLRRIHEVRDPQAGE